MKKDVDEVLQALKRKSWGKIKITWINFHLLRYLSESQ